MKSVKLISHSGEITEHDPQQAQAILTLQHLRGWDGKMRLTVSPDCDWEWEDIHKALKLKKRDAAVGSKEVSDGSKERKLRDEGSATRKATKVS